MGMISDFERRGDEPIPDSAVREGLTIALQQSRYVNVFPRARVYESLQRMKRSDVSGIDENLGREICQRENPRPFSPEASSTLGMCSRLPCGP